MLNLRTDCPHPVLLRNAAAEWNAVDFDIVQRLLKGDLSDVHTQFRVHSRHGRSSREYEGIYITATMKDFSDWYYSEDGGSFSLPFQHPFAEIPKRSSGEVFVYADYKHFCELFGDDKDIFHAKWSDVLEDYPSNILSPTSDNTLWLGTLGAHTPLHYDTYGCNIVAQVTGYKKWKLWVKSKAGLSKCRVPYEESSVYSEYDPLEDGDSIPPDYEYLLGPGDVLFIPKHAWHFVTTESEIALSINQWIPVPSDKVDRLSEAIIKFTFDAVKNAMEKANAPVRDYRRGWVTTPAAAVSCSCDEERDEEDDDCDKNDYGEVEDEASIHRSNLEIISLTLSDLLEANAYGTAIYSTARPRPQPSSPTAFSMNISADSSSCTHAGGDRSQISGLNGREADDKFELRMKRIVSQLLHDDNIFKCISEATRS